MVYDEGSLSSFCIYKITAAVCLQVSYAS